MTSSLPFLSELDIPWALEGVYIFSFTWLVVILKLLSLFRTHNFDTKLPTRECLVWNYSLLVMETIEIWMFETKMEIF